MRWYCTQNGAREHYAIPRALKKSGKLGALFTEFWAGPQVRQFAFGPLKSAAARWHRDLAKGADGSGDPQIVSWNRQAIWRGLRSRLNAGRENQYEVHIRSGRWFAEKVIGFLEMQRTNVRGSVVFSYDTTALELFRWAKLRGAVCVLGQMDASRLEAELVCGEEKRWAGWALQTTKIPEAFFLRREAEWCIADRIIVNSRWSFDSLIKQGVPAEKLVIIPLCYEANDPMTSRASAADILGDDPDGTPRPDCLRVLFLGQVILGKGIQYLVEAAEELQSESVQIDVVGHIGISDRAVRSAPSNLTFHGRCSRQQARFWYDRSGIFVLPTISDGFAITQIEAMAHGLPVIATPHCGQVVTDGADGFIVPARDSAALASAIRRYLEFPNLRCQHAVAARQKAQQFKLDRLVGDLATLEIDLSAHAGFGRCEAGKCAEESEIGAVRVF